MLREDFDKYFSEDVLAIVHEHEKEVIVWKVKSDERMEPRIIELIAAGMDREDARRVAWKELNVWADRCIINNKYFERVRAEMAKEVHVLYDKQRFRASKYALKWMNKQTEEYIQAGCSNEAARLLAACEDSPLRKSLQSLALEYDKIAQFVDAMAELLRGNEYGMCRGESNIAKVYLDQWRDRSF